MSLDFLMETLVKFACYPFLAFSVAVMALGFVPFVALAEDAGSATADEMEAVIVEAEDAAAGASDEAVEAATEAAPQRPAPDPTLSAPIVVRESAWRRFRDAATRSGEIAFDAIFIKIPSVGACLVGAPMYLVVAPFAAIEGEYEEPFDLFVRAPYERLTRPLGEFGFDG